MAKVIQTSHIGPKDKQSDFPDFNRLDLVQTCPVSLRNCYHKLHKRI